MKLIEFLQVKNHTDFPLASKVLQYRSPILCWHFAKFSFLPFFHLFFLALPPWNWYETVCFLDLLIGMTWWLL